jgi:hypothetical protein
LEHLQLKLHSVAGTSESTANSRTGPFFFLFINPNDPLWVPGYQEEVNATIEKANIKLPKIRAKMSESNWNSLGKRGVSLNVINYYST